MAPLDELPAEVRSPPEAQAWIRSPAEGDAPKVGCIGIFCEVPNDLAVPTARLWAGYPQGLSLAMGFREMLCSEPRFTNFDAVYLVAEPGIFGGGMSLGYERMRDRMSLRVGVSALYTWLRGPTWDAGSVLVGPSAELGVLWAHARLGAYVDMTDGRFRVAPNVGVAIGW